MPWAREPATEDSVREFLQGARKAWNDGLDFGYAIRDLGEPTEIIGSCGLHFRDGPGVAEIGYWVRTDRTGAGLATDAARALTRAARQLDEVSRVEIHCDVANLASRAIPPKLGYRLDRIDRRPAEPRTPGETDELMIWVLPG